MERKAQELCITAAQSGFMQVGFNTKIRGVWGFMASNCLYWDFIVTLFYTSVCTHLLEVTRTPPQPGPLHSQRSTCGPFALTSSEGRRHPAVKGPCRRHLRLLLRVSGVGGVHRGYTGLCPYACHTEPSRLPQANHPHRILRGPCRGADPYKRGLSTGTTGRGACGPDARSLNTLLGDTMCWLPEQPAPAQGTCSQPCPAPPPG